MQKKDVLREGKSPFRGLWWYQNGNGNWDLTRTPSIWCETYNDWSYLR